MKKTLFVLSCLTLFGCCNESPVVKESPAVETGKPGTIDSFPEKVNAADWSDLKKIAAKYVKPSQIFSVSASKSSVVTGKKGTKIHVEPSDLVLENGQPAEKNIEVELKELLTSADMLLSGAQTVSDGRLLVSGGSYYINMTSGGSQLRLKTGSTLKVEFPKVADAGMQLFYGKKDSMGLMNWKPDAQNFSVNKKEKPEKTSEKTTGKIKVNKPDTTSSGYDHIDKAIAFIRDAASKSATFTPEEVKELKKADDIAVQMYAAMRLSSFGWINCDRFYGVENKTDLIVTADPAKKIRCLNLYLVFKNINSVMQDVYYKTDFKSDVHGIIRNIPVGSQARLIIYGVKDTKVFSCASQVTVKAGEKVSVDLRETTDEELKEMLKAG